MDSIMRVVRMHPETAYATCTAGDDSDGAAENGDGDVCGKGLKRRVRPAVAVVVGNGGGSADGQPCRKDWSVGVVTGCRDDRITRAPPRGARRRRTR